MRFFLTAEITVHFNETSDNTLKNTPEKWQQAAIFALCSHRLFMPAESGNCGNLSLMALQPVCATPRQQGKRKPVAKNTSMCRYFGNKQKKCHSRNPAIGRVISRRENKSKLAFAGNNYTNTKADSKETVCMCIYDWWVSQGRHEHLWIPWLRECCFQSRFDASACCNASALGLSSPEPDRSLVLKR